MYVHSVVSVLITLSFIIQYNYYVKHFRGGILKPEHQAILYICEFFQVVTTPQVEENGESNQKFYIIFKWVLFLQVL